MTETTDGTDRSSLVEGTQERAVPRDTFQIECQSDQTLSSAASSPNVCFGILSALNVITLGAICVLTMFVLHLQSQLNEQKLCNASWTNGTLDELGLCVSCTSLQNEYTLDSNSTIQALRQRDSNGNDNLCCASTSQQVEFLLHSVIVLQLTNFLFPSDFFLFLVAICYFYL